VRYRARAVGVCAAVAEESTHMAKTQRGKNPAPAQTAPKPKAKRVRVVAVGKTGYYDHARRREGDVFDIDEKDFSDADNPEYQGWMRKVPMTTELSHSTSQDEINRQHDEILSARAGAVDKDVI
jgi:hypothetical protein